MVVSQTAGKLIFTEEVPEVYNITEGVHVVKIDESNHYIIDRRYGLCFVGNGKTLTPMADKDCYNLLNKSVQDTLVNQSRQRWAQSYYL